MGCPLCRDCRKLATAIWSEALERRVVVGNQVMERQPSWGMLVNVRIFMKHPVDIYVGKRIRHRRWVNGMTQQQLAEGVGIKFQQIQKYETGANRVSASRLWDIANVLGVPVAFFFEGLDEHSAIDASGTDVRGDILTDKESLDLLWAYYAIPAIKRRGLFDLARVLSRD